MDEFKTFSCGNGHVLGVVVRNGRGIRSLLVYRYALDPTAESIPEPDVLGVVDSAMEVRCSICEEHRAWVPGEAELEAIIQRFARRQRGEAAEAIIVKDMVKI